uniref:Uncharacterized protein n=1 Tax=Arundo donax TaxID=35708 RepID=A0A0A9FSL2_ARUDO
MRQLDIPSPTTSHLHETPVEYKSHLLPCFLVPFFHPSPPLLPIDTTRSVPSRCCGGDGGGGEGRGVTAAR